MNNKGYTLIELVIAIAVIGIGLSVFIRLINANMLSSVDPMLQQQANAIATAYLEEIYLRPFCDHDITDSCPSSCNSGNTCSNANCTENTNGTETRATFDDVCDYTRLPDNFVRDQLGNRITGLDNYRVNVAIRDDSRADILGISGQSSQSLLIQVNVSNINDANVSAAMSAYRLNF